MEVDRLIVRLCREGALMNQNDKVQDIEDGIPNATAAQQTHIDPDAAHDEAADASLDDPARTLVRFAQLRNKARPPSSYIHIDEALNALGIKLHPTEWGIG